MSEVVSTSAPPPVGGTLIETIPNTAPQLPAKSQPRPLRARTRPLRSPLQPRPGASRRQDAQAGQQDREQSPFDVQPSLHLQWARTTRKVKPVVTPTRGATPHKNCATSNTVGWRGQVDVNLWEAWRRATSERVEIACGGGRGRTGTALACLAVLDGLPAHEAVAYVRQRYHPRAVETPWQRRYVAQFPASKGFRTLSSS